MWSLQDVARDAVRRHAADLAAQIAAEVAEAATRARQTDADAHRGVRAPPPNTSPTRARRSRR